jgi:hypothetical protein
MPSRWQRETAKREVGSAPEEYKDDKRLKMER